MYETPSLFDAMEQDHTMHRVASRCALALAHTRVEQRLGGFLRGAQNVEEFDARLALVQDDFAHYVASAAEEVGYDTPQHIAASLLDHYRLAAGVVKFDPTPEEDEEDEGVDNPKAANTHTALLGQDPTAPGMDPMNPMDAAVQQYPQAGGAPPGVQPNPLQRTPGVAPPVQPNPQAVAAPGTQPPQPNPQPGVNAPLPGQPPTPPPTLASWKVTALEGKQGLPLATADRYPPGRVGVAKEAVPPEWNRQGATFGEQPSGYDQSSPINATAQRYQDLLSQGRADEAQFTLTKLHQMMQGVPDARVPDTFPAEWVHRASSPSDQTSNESDMVTCPQCGGDGDAENNGNSCAKCHGKGKVPNFGDSMLDALDGKSSSIRRSWSVVAAPEGNTGLGGPEPKIDKAHKYPEKYKEDSRRWPTKEKDIVVPIKAINREEEGHEPEETGQATTEKVELDSASPNETGFYDGGETNGPHTKTFDGKGQAKPVTVR